jgi:hypothetical protein
MGTLGDGNGGNRPPDNGGQPDGVPDLPPEWGVIVIPDDPAELAEEATSLRRELRKAARRNRWRRRLHLPVRGDRSAEDDSSALGIPLLIMSIAVLATLTSLFAVAWPGQPRPPALQPTGQTVVSAPAGTQMSASIADVTLTDPAGTPVRLHDLLPAVVVLIDGCRCESLLASIAAADPEVTVVAVAPTLPAGTAVPTGPRMRLLVDTGGGLHRAVSGLARSPGRAGVLLVAADGTLVRTLPAVGSVDEFRADLPRLH